MAAANPVAMVPATVANADFFILFPSSSLLAVALGLSAGRPSRRSDVLNQQVRGLIPLAEIDRQLAECVPFQVI
jgi:hypothetical protein